MSMRAKPWEVPDGLWERLEPLLPAKQRRFRYPGRKPLDDRRVLQGILFVLHTGIGWEHLPQELGFGCGMTAWRRLRAWQQAGVWERLHELLLAELQAADQLEWERAVADSSHLQAKKGAPRRVPDRARLRARPSPLGRRTHLRLAPQPPPAPHPHRPPRRHPRSIPRPRLLPHLLATAGDLIQLGPLSVGVTRDASVRSLRRRLRV